MTPKELEEALYEYGNLMYRIGRMETDDKSSTKEYNKVVKEKEMLAEKFNQHFGTFCKKFGKD